jgi:hypothetical protein
MDVNAEEASDNVVTVELEGGGDKMLVPGRYPLADTDVELAINRVGNDLIVRLNKAGTNQVFRAVLVDVCKDMPQEQLVGFIPFAPDVRFRIGDINEGLRRAFTTTGLLSGSRGR